MKGWMQLLRPSLSCLCSFVLVLSLMPLIVRVSAQQPVANGEILRDTSFTVFSAKQKPTASGSGYVQLALPEKGISLEA
jgi:hypothetical protein